MLFLSGIAAYFLPNILICSSDWHTITVFPSLLLKCFLMGILLPTAVFSMKFVDSDSNFKPKGSIIRTGFSTGCCYGPLPGLVSHSCSIVSLA